MRASLVSSSLIVGAIAALFVADGSLGCGPSMTPASSSIAGDGGPDAPESTLDWSTAHAGAHASLAAVWGAGARDVLAAGNFPPTVIRSSDDGATWSDVTPRGLDPNLTLAGVGGSGADDVYVVGEFGYSPRIFHSADEGATWSESDLPIAGGMLWGVWASGPGDTYVVGDEATNGAMIARSADHGATWSTQIVPLASTLTSIWGSGPNDVYVAGDALSSSTATSDGGAGDASSSWVGVVLHSTDGGKTWTLATTTPTGALYAITGTADGARIDAVGAGDTIVESTDHGATWTVLAGAAGKDDVLRSVWLSSDDPRPFVATMLGVARDVDVDPSGGAALAVEGLPGADPRVVALWGRSAEDLFAVGPGGVFVRRRD